MYGSLLTKRVGNHQFTKYDGSIPVLATIRVCDIEVDIGGIRWQSGGKPSAWARQAEGAVVGQLGKLRPIGNRPTGTLARDGGGRQPPRMLPAQCHLVFDNHNVFMALRLNDPKCRGELEREKRKDTPKLQACNFECGFSVPGKVCVISGLRDSYEN
jgi:hypothetical protein